MGDDTLIGSNTSIAIDRLFALVARGDTVREIYSVYINKYAFSILIVGGSFGLGHFKK